MQKNIIDLTEIKEEHLHNWGILQGFLDSISCVKTKITLLQTILSKNIYLCYDGKCPIFENIKKLRSELMNIGFSYTTKDKIKNSSELTEIEKKEKLDQIEKLTLHCDNTLQEMMKIASVNKANIDKEKEFHKLRIELIQEINKSNHPLPINLGDDIASAIGFKFPGYEDLESRKKFEEEKKKKRKEKENERDKKRKT